MQLSRPFFLSLPCTTHQGASGMCERLNMISLAFVYCSQRLRDSRSIGLSFHCFNGSLMRQRNRNSCSSSGIENQYLISWMPERTSIRSKSGTERKNSSYSSSEQNPMTFSTPARLYQLRSNRTISPAAGRCSTYRWKYHCVFSRLEGAGNATTRATRGL